MRRIFKKANSEVMPQNSHNPQNDHHAGRSGMGTPPLRIPTMLRMMTASAMERSGAFHAGGNCGSFLLLRIPTILRMRCAKGILGIVRILRTLRWLLRSATPSAVPQATPREVKPASLLVGAKENARAAYRHPGSRPIVTPCHATPCLAVPCLWKARHRRRRRASNVRYARQAVRQPQGLRRGCGCLCPGRQGPDDSRSLALRRKRRSVEHGPPSERSLSWDRATRKHERET